MSFGLGYTLLTCKYNGNVAVFLHAAKKIKYFLFFEPVRFADKPFHAVAVNSMPEVSFWHGYQQLNSRINRCVGNKVLQSEHACSYRFSFAEQAVNLLLITDFFSFPEGISGFGTYHQVWS